MEVLQNISEPLKVTVPSIDLPVQLRQVNLKGDIVSSQKMALILFEAYYVYYNWG